MMSRVGSLSTETGSSSTGCVIDQATGECAKTSFVSPFVRPLIARSTGGGADLQYERKTQGPLIFFKLHKASFLGEPAFPGEALDAAAKISDIVKSATSSDAF